MQKGKVIGMDKLNHTLNIMLKLSVKDPTG